MKFEIDGNVAVIRLPENVKTARIFTSSKRIELTRVGEDVKATIVDRPQQK